MPRSGPLGVGLIGAGMISTQYLDHLTTFPDVRVLRIGDLDVDRAAAQARAYGLPAWGTGADVLADPDVELVVNLTIPAVHAEISRAAVAARKHVWSEKPMAVERAEGRQLLDAAAEAGVRIGVAPDTVLGPAVQTARRAVERGDIGTPLAATTVMQYSGPDSFHPNPEFLFARGAGPVQDMGPYYVSALVNLLGPVDKVAAVGSTSRQTRLVRVGDRVGTPFPVEVPTHVAVLLAFEGGTVGQSVFSFDSPLTRMGVVEITGTDGTLLVPDPNYFNGPVKITRTPAPDAVANEPVWETVEQIGVTSGRGLGILDMARAIRSGQPHIATGELGYHILDVLTCIEEAVVVAETVTVTSTVGPIPLVPKDRDPMAATL
ncbi:MAG TPA: Gfo/Idh/MocA family oxidoreductase [Dermatophilaceae bacterium]|nr:Gfo/Idh/MocA family oxidoreductase [Dermatophilaceae bacterium]